MPGLPDVPLQHLASDDFGVRQPPANRVEPLREASNSLKPGGTLTARLTPDPPGCSPLVRSSHAFCQWGQGCQLAPWATIVS